MKEFVSKSVLKKLFQFYIDANIHVAIAAACTVLVTGVFFKVSVLIPSLFIGLSTFVSYNFIRLKKFQEKKLKTNLEVWFQNNKKLLFVLNAIAVGFLFVLSIKISHMGIVVMFPFAIITALYMLPVFNRENQTISLRSIPRFKIFSIAISWAGLCVFFPLAEVGIAFGEIPMLYFIAILFFVFTLILPFDIRDMRFDSKELQTIPQVLGINKTKVVGFIVLIVSFILLLFCVNENFLIFKTAIIYVVLLLFLLISSEMQKIYFASFWVEAIPVFWFVILEI